MLASFFNVYTAPVNELSSCLISSNTTAAATNCILADAFSLNLTLCIALSVFVFLASLVTNNDSWVDRFWSIYPVACSWIFALFRGLKEQAAAIKTKSCPYSAFFKCPTLSSPQVLFCAVITLWGIRLTYNFYRRGGYKKGGEDYRWMYVRTWPLLNFRPIWIIFSFFIVSFFQIALLFAITVPVSQLPSNVAAKCSDYIMLALFLFFLTLEASADQQQWDFQQFKYGTNNKKTAVPVGIAEDCKRGFMTHGLFSLSRHPNVFSEQSIWVTVFLSTLSYAGVSGSCLGAVTLIYLTLGSSVLTEKISASKYPMYAIYQTTTPFIYPSVIPTRHYIDASMADVAVPQKNTSVANAVLPRKVATAALVGGSSSSLVGTAARLSATTAKLSATSTSASTTTTTTTTTTTLAATPTARRSISTKRK